MGASIKGKAGSSSIREQNSFQTQAPRRAPTRGLIGRGTYAGHESVLLVMSFLVALIVIRSHSSLFHSCRALLFFFCNLSIFPLLSLHCSLSHRTPPSPLLPSVPLLGLHPQASCVYILVVYFYKCQTVFLPSVY